MLIEEEEGKATGELSPEVFDAFVEVDTVEEEEVIIFGDDDREDTVDLAFTEDEGYW